MTLLFQKPGVCNPVFLFTVQVANAFVLMIHVGQNRLGELKTPSESSGLFASDVDFYSLPLGILVKKNLGT